MYLYDVTFYHVHLILVFVFKIAIKKSLTIVLNVYIKMYTHNTHRGSERKFPQKQESKSDKL